MQGYLRDLTQEDIEFLQPYLGNILHDSILLCPPLGFDDEVLVAEQSSMPGAAGSRGPLQADSNAAEVSAVHLFLSIAHAIHTPPGLEAL